MVLRQQIIQLSELLFSLLAWILVLIVFCNPPTDSDGGPMMAYNFLFFIPMILSAGALSLISLMILIRKLYRKDWSLKLVKILSFCLLLPVLLYAIWIGIQYSPIFAALLYSAL